jgi:solute:Na+ symporter, SSS family
MNGSLRTADWIVIGCYFAILFVIAVYYRRFAGRSLDEFFLGGRRNSGWSNGLAYAGALMNADVAPGYGGFAVASGLFVCWLYLSRFGIALFFGAILFAVFWRRLNLFTTPEFYELRFGGTASRVIRTWVAGKSALLAMVAWTGTGLLALHKIGGPILGFESRTTTMLVVVPIVIGYVFLSGFAGSAATSSLHTLIMLVGSAMLCGIVLWQHGGPTALASQLQAAAGPDMLSAMPPLDHRVLPLAAVLAWMIGTSLGYGGDTAPLGGAMEGQYLFSSKNAREASKMYIVAEVSLFLLLLLITLPALAAAIHWPGLRLSSSDPAWIDREMAYGLMMAKYLPPGMLGLLFVGMLASVMSTIGGNLTFGAQLLVNDVYRRHLRPRQSERHYVWVGRAAVVLILMLAVVVVYRVELIFNVAAFMVAASVAEMPANWAQWWWWRFNAWGRLTASFGGLIIPAIIWFAPPTASWQWWDKTYLAIAVNMGLTLLVTLITSPDQPSILDRFYRAARPLGAWRPVTSRLGCHPLEPRSGGADRNRFSAESGATLIPLGLALALLGAASVMLMVVGLSYLYVGGLGPGLACLSAFAVGAAAFLRTYGPYLDRLERWAPRQPDHAMTPTDATAAEGAAEHATVPSHAWSGPEHSPGSGPSSEPMSTDSVVALSMLFYGSLFLGGGLLWTRGEQLVMNLLAGGGFLGVGVIVWWLGRIRGASAGEDSAKEAMMVAET